MRKLYLLCFVLFATVSNAAIETYDFESAQMEANYFKLIKELRCLVCQNQNLADSNADLARDLRSQAYKMLMQGDSSEQVVDYMVARYGDFVMYRPRLKPSTLLLWLGPFVLLALVLVLVIRSMRKKQVLQPPDSESMTRAEQFLSNTEDKL
ncbi:MAG: cytochrome c-type biogenesis protein CcmH [Proteobacteria bacterium]|nr:cytochrome c-type biogenesis protein CcmH [Pseudomonadota bacterium]